MKPLVIVAAKISDTFQLFLNQHYTLSYDYTSATNFAQAVGVVTSTKLHFDKNLLSTMPRLKWIARLGSGMEIIDLDYCKNNGIQCFNSPAGIANAVSEGVVSMLLNLNRYTAKAANEVREGLWLREENRGLELCDATVGIIGFGNTGTQTAHKLKPFVHKILAFDKYKNVESATVQAVQNISDIYEQADIVTYHVPYNSETHGYYQPENFSKKHILVNISRGGVATTADILRGFAAGILSGACLDVLDFENEFPELSSQSQQLLQQLLSYNCIVTPHIAGYSVNAIGKMCAELQAQIQQVVLS